MFLAIGIVLCFTGIITLLASICQYMKKGAILCPAYFAANEQEREAMRKKETYIQSGGNLMQSAICILCLSACFIFENAAFGMAGAGVALSSALGKFLYMIMNDVK